jgi:hypothetical protein
MRRPFSRLAAASALSVAIASLTIGPAFAGGNPNAPGQEKKSDATAQPAAQQPAAQQPAAQSGSPSQGGNGNASQPGMKPANNTAHGTSCQYQNSTTCTANSPSTSQSAAKQDASKHYGNGKTAAQIAASKGVPAGSTIYGPGNSQPHKVTCPGGTKGPDVHAYKSGKHSCGSATVQTQAPQTRAPQTPAPQTPAPQNQAPQTPAPQNQAPQSQAPQTQAPQTQAPQVSGSTGNVAGTTSAGGVKGATTTLGKPKARGAHGGVLGTTAKIRGGRLPFTGFPTWLAALLGIGMILGGATLRARTQQ